MGSQYSQIHQSFPPWFWVELNFLEPILTKGKISGNESDIPNDILTPSQP